MTGWKQLGKGYYRQLIANTFWVMINGKMFSVNGMETVTKMLCK